MNEAQLFEKLAKELLEKNYPKKALVNEFYYRGRRLDFAVLDPDTGFPLAFFEVKYFKSQKTGTGSPTSMEEYFNQIIDEQKNAPVRAKEHAQYLDYLSFFKTRFFFISEDTAGQLKFHELTRSLEGEPELFPYEEPPSFEELRQSFPNIIRLNREQDKRRNIDWFWFVSWVLALLVIGILLLDAFCLYTVTLERLYFTVLAVLLILAPRIVKISVAGLEIVRAKRQEEDSLEP